MATGWGETTVQGGHVQLLRDAAGTRTRDLAHSRRAPCPQDLTRHKAKSPPARDKNIFSPTPLLWAQEQGVTPPPQLEIRRGP